MRKILNYTLILVLFYFASLIERQMTEINFKNPDKSKMWKEIGRGFILFVICSFWILALFSANQGVVSSDE